MIFRHDERSVQVPVPSRCVPAGIRANPSKRRSPTAPAIVPWFPLPFAAITLCTALLTRSSLKDFSLTRNSMRPSVEGKGVALGADGFVVVGGTGGGRGGEDEGLSMAWPCSSIHCAQTAARHPPRSGAVHLSGGMFSGFSTSGCMNSSRASLYGKGSGTWGWEWDGRIRARQSEPHLCAVP